jgi:S-adenosylmethionine:tRNA ribosyltransferase-isomerase
MLITEFDFNLPEDLIAQEPLENRESSRMLCVNRETNSFSNNEFRNFPKFLRADDVIVVNNTKVFPARLFGISETGGKIELFLVKNVENHVWETLARPAKRLNVGKQISFCENLNATVLDKNEEGRVIVEFETNGDFHSILEEIGETPLPPYIKRNHGTLDKDRNRYQTVYASEKGAIAAPTAGLHFTPEVIEEVKSNGVTVAEITLHVGYGTFEPVRVTDLSDHKVLPEQFEISPETAEILNRAKQNKSRIIAIGTTTTRALETTFSTGGKFLTGKQTADLTITPNYKFKAIDGLLTNFHLPQSSLLVLVSTFAGFDLTMNTYRSAVENRYRFYSYGDCMLIL